MKLRIAGIFLLTGIIVSWGCIKKNENTEGMAVGDRLGAALPANGQELDIIVLYDHKDEAEQDRKFNGLKPEDVEVLNSDGRLIRIRGSRDAVRKLVLSQNTLMSHNSPFRIHHKNREHPVSGGGGPVPLDLLTVRSVVGLNEFLERFPDADGTGLKVAVFDTGIDFGIKGLSEVENGRSRLAGFYDFSGFGLVQVSELPEDGEQIPEFADSIEPAELTGFGILSESELARNYYTPEPVDLNGNGRSDDQFVFVTGINREGVPAVWIDADGNGRIDSRSDEELTDYNKTYRYVNLMARGELPGVHSLAVTIRQDSRLQFHTVPHGHGTSCALIIGGNGYGDGSLMGLAPGVSFLSYTLDVTGQDVYTMDEFIRMFLHARDKGADAISISWGFSTADLGSARFFADFLDREIASRGVVIGIAAGNNGPGVGSAAGDDYIPHHGFGVGAMISKDQAVNVYGWTGTDRDAVVDYSSFGPTPGGRLIPDIVSPIISMVRGVRSDDSDPFYGFSGTSSATPALVGALMAMVSALPEGEKIDTRLLKLAVQEGARKVAETLSIRQGPGLVRIDQAFDIYRAFKTEMDKAEADRSRQTHFPFELRTETTLENRPGSGEGVYLHDIQPDSLVKIHLSEASRALIDPVTFYAPLLLSHDQDFFEIPSVLNLQSSGGSFRIRFKTEMLQVNSGVYSDVIEVRRPGDHAVLLRIPVVLQIPSESEGTTIVSVSERMESFSIWRMPVSLREASSVSFKGMVLADSGYEGARLGFYIRANDGHVADARRVYLSGSLTPVDFTSDELPSGDYELVISRNYRRPATVQPVSLYGVWSRPRLQILAQQTEEADGILSLVIKAREPLDGLYWSLRRAGAHGTSALILNRSAERPGFYGALQLPFAARNLSVGLRQNGPDRIMSRMLHMSLTLMDPESGDSRYRGWIDVQDQGSPLEAAGLNRSESVLDVMAYPNIVHWDHSGVHSVNLAWQIPFGQVKEERFHPLEAVTLDVGSISYLRFGNDIAPGEYGELRLHDRNGEILEAVPVRY